MTKITSVGFVTRNRLEALRRGAISYIENCLRHERMSRFVVVDDSVSSESRNAYRQMLSALKAQYGVEILYAGQEEKACFVDRLVGVGDIPPEVVNFALWGVVGGRGSTIGANRNALLLHTVGEAILSVDDDTICHLALAPDAEDCPIITSEQARPDIWFFPNREAALQSINFCEQDLLAIHELYLGEEMHFQSVEMADRIRITSNGIVGDCGWDWPSFMFLAGNSFKRLTQSESSYRSACTSREILQVVRNVTITNQMSGFMTTVVGFDNRRLLPPFIPLIVMGRNEEMAFEAILRACFTDSWIAYLPWALLHAPVEARSFSSDERSAFFMGLPFLIQLCAFTFQHKFFKAGDEEGNLSRLGRYLEELGNRPGSEFEAFVQWQFQPIAASLISEAENRLNSAELPEFWISDLKRFIARMKRELTSLLDFLYGYTPEGCERTQDLLRRFGQLLRWWPGIVETARNLRTQGYDLAQPV